MLDIKFIRENPDFVKKSAQNKGYAVDIDRLLALDKKRRELIQKRDWLRRERKEISEKVREDPAVREKAREIKENLKRSESDLEKVEAELEPLLYSVPNPALPEVPLGRDESDNVVIKEWGKKPKFSFKPRDYLTLAEKLDIIDIKRAAKVSGSRFGYLKGKAVLLEFALVNFTFDFLTKKGFIPTVPPVMIKPEMMAGMGYLEAESEKLKVKNREQELYFLRDDDLVLVGTSEQSIGPMHADEIFAEKDLPRRYVAFSTCFRREAGSYGKDTKGILRVHQFDKIEMFSFTKPEQSKKEHQFLLSLEELLMQALKIPYRVVQICTGDLGMPAAAKYDIEAWLPGQGKYRETHSTSNCTDFQARRLNIRYRHSKTGRLEFVHTLNGTAFAIGRTLIAIIENYQQKDGSIKVPRALQKYVRFKAIK